MKSVFLIFLFLQATSCLKLVRVLVPQVTKRGDPAVLQCQYDLEGDSLYSVKWYKDNEEFFRFVPRAHPALHSYRIEGIKVDHHKSDSKKVFLKSVTLKTSGVYRCEVSAEAPSFASVQGEGTINVVYLPKDGPHITGDKSQYEIGEEISLNCTSGKSHPPSQLQWYINGKLVTQSDLLIPYSHIVFPSGVVTSTLGLQLTVDADHFIGGSMRVRCVSSLMPVALHSVPKSLMSLDDAVEPLTPVLDNREALLLVKSSATRASSLRTIAILFSSIMLYYYR